MYLVIAVAQVRTRRQVERTQPEALTLKMWFFPWLSYLTIAGMGVVIAAMAVLPDTRAKFLVGTLGSLAHLRRDLQFLEPWRNPRDGGVQGVGNVLGAPLRRPHAVVNT